MANPKFNKFKDVTTSAQTSETLKGTGYPDGTFELLSASVTTGATIVLEGSLSGTNWDTILTIAVTANGSAFRRFEKAAYRYYRVRATSITDGTHSPYVLIHGDTGMGYLAGEG